MTTQANQSEFDRWNGDRGKGWVDDADQRDVALAPVAAELLAAAQLAPGELVLDIGCGCGATTLAAGLGGGTRRRGAGRRPVRHDARRGASSPGRDPRSNVTLLQADAQTHPLPTAAHDVAISRFGTMFFDDPGGRLHQHRPEPALRRSALHRHVAAQWRPTSGWPAPSRRCSAANHPQPRQVRACSPSPTQIERSACAPRCGFVDVAVRPHTIAMWLGADAGEAGRYVASTSVGQQLLAELDDAARAAAIDHVIDAVRPSETSDGVRLDGGIFIVTASVHR